MDSQASGQSRLTGILFTTMCAGKFIVDLTSLKVTAGSDCITFHLTDMACLGGRREETDVIGFLICKY